MRQFTVRSAFSVLVAALCLVAPATAQETRSGWWVKMDAGPGSSTLTSDADAEMGGTATIVSLAVGKFLGDNLVGYLEAFGSPVSGPEVRQAGSSVVAGSEYEVNLSGLTAGAGYYAVPDLLFIGGGVGIGTISIDEDQTTIASTETGLTATFQASLGFKVGDRWQVGAGAHVFFGSANDQGGSPRWTGVSYGLGFSVAYAGDGWNPR